MSLNLNHADFSARPVTMDDAEMMLSWRNEAPVREGMFHSRLISIDDQIPWLRKRIEAEDCFYYIFEFQNRPTGVFGVYDISVEQGVGEWVYFMGPRYDGLPRGAGAAMEFVAMDTFFGSHNLRRVWGRTLKTNARVWQMHQRFGFEVEGVLREHVVKDGEVIDLLCVGLLAREWAIKRKEQFPMLFARPAAS